jgi:heme exporter protein A
MLTGILPSSSGHVSYCEQPLSDCRYEYLSDVLFIGHQSGVKAALTVEENLRWMSPNNTSSEKITTALEAVGLSEYAQIHCANLSAGQKRRVALARLMTAQAKLWFLDEPLTSLDKQGVEVIERCMNQHLAQGGAILFSSHQDLAQVTTRNYRLEPLVEVA